MISVTFTLLSGNALSLSRTVTKVKHRQQNTARFQIGRPFYAAIWTLPALCNNYVLLESRNMDGRHPETPQGTQKTVGQTEESFYSDAV